MLLLPEGDSGKAWKPSNKATALSDTEEHWIHEHYAIVSLQRVCSHTDRLVLWSLRWQDVLLHRRPHLVRA